MKLEELNEVRLECALVDSGWEIEEIEMEPTVSGSVPEVGVTIDGQPFGHAVYLHPSAVRYTTVLLARKGDKVLATAYDRRSPDPVRAVALLFLAQEVEAATLKA